MVVVEIMFSISFCVVLFFMCVFFVMYLGLIIGVMVMLVSLESGELGLQEILFVSKLFFFAFFNVLSMQGVVLEVVMLMIILCCVGWYVVIFFQFCLWLFFVNFMVFWIVLLLFVINLIIRLKGMLKVGGYLEVLIILSWLFVLVLRQNNWLLVCM